MAGLRRIKLGERVKIEIDRKRTNGGPKTIAPARHYGAIRRIEDPPGAPKAKLDITIHDVTAYHTRAQFYDAGLGDPAPWIVMGWQAHNLGLADPGNASQVDTLSFALAKGFPDNDTNTSFFPFLSQPLTYFTAPGQSVQYRSVPKCWYFPFENVEQLGELRFKLGNQTRSTLPADAAWRLRTPAQARIDAILGAGGPADDEASQQAFQFLQYEALETGSPEDRRDTVWGGEDEFVDYRDWWNNYGLFKLKLPDKSKVALLDGGIYYEEFDCRNTDDFKCTLSDDFDADEVAMPGMPKPKSGLQVRVMLVPKLWKVTINFNTHDSDANPTAREFVFYITARATPFSAFGALSVLDWNDEDLIPIYGGPVQANSALTSDMQLISYLVEFIGSTNALMFAAAGGGDAFYVQQPTGPETGRYLIGSEGRITVETAGVSPARMLAALIRTGSDSETEKQFRIWRRTAQSRATVKIIDDQPYDSVRGVKALSGTFATRVGAIKSGAWPF
jgi:hypothetical protein